MTTETGYCACGCGAEVKPGRQYISGHHLRVVGRGRKAMTTDALTEDEKTLIRESVTDAATAAQNYSGKMPTDEVMESKTPGMYVPTNKFVVLTSRLGRPMQPQDKIDPNDPTETTKYFVPEAFERGTVIELSDLYTGKAQGYIDNVDRLLKLQAIGRLDHEDAQSAIRELAFRREQEAANREKAFARA